MLIIHCIFAEATQRNIKEAKVADIELAVADALKYAPKNKVST